MDKKEYKVGDRFYWKVHDHWGTVVAIDGDMGLIDWDEKQFSWGLNKPNKHWINLKTHRMPKARSLAGEFTKKYWR